MNTHGDNRGRLPPKARRENSFVWHESTMSNNRSVTGFFNSARTSMTDQKSAPASKEDIQVMQQYIADQLALETAQLKVMLRGIITTLSDVQKSTSRAGSKENVRRFDILPSIPSASMIGSCIEPRCTESRPLTSIDHFQTMTSSCNTGIWRVTAPHGGCEQNGEKAGNGDQTLFSLGDVNSFCRQTSDSGECATIPEESERGLGSAPASVQASPCAGLERSPLPLWLQEDKPEAYRSINGPHGCGISIDLPPRPTCGQISGDYSSSNVDDRCTDFEVESQDRHSAWDKESTVLRNFSAESYGSEEDKMRASYESPIVDKNVGQDKIRASYESPIVENVGQDNPVMLPASDFDQIPVLETNNPFCAAESSGIKYVASNTDTQSHPSGPSGGPSHMAIKFNALKSTIAGEEVTLGVSNLLISGSKKRRFILFPDSIQRNAWDLCSTFVLLYDVLVIPYSLAWRDHDTTFSTLGNWSTLLFWSFDILISFFTAFYVNGDLETRLRVIACHYIRTTFVLDAAVTGTDWVTAFHSLTSDGSDSNASVVNVLRLLKAQRLLRVVRFLRVSTVWSRLERMHSIFLTDDWHLFCQLLSMFCGMFMINHLLSCMWYILGWAAPQDTGTGWLEADPAGYKSVQDFSTLYQYLTSFQWCVTQMYVGSSEVMSRNSYEKVFNIMCNLFGTLFSAVLTSWFSALLVQHKKSKYDFELQMKSVRRYLRQNNVEPGIASRIHKQVAIKLSARKRDVESEIKAFDLLSNRLRAEMRRDILQASLFTYDFVFLLDRLDTRVILNMCLYLQTQSHVVGDEFFQPKVVMEAPYLIVHGKFAYTRNETKQLCEPTSTESLKSTRHDPDMQDVLTDVHGVACGSGTWMAEATLWTSKWQTQGRMECIAHSEVVTIAPRKFHKILSASSRMDMFVKAYRTSYQTLFKTVPSDVLTDIHSPVDHAMVIMIMASHARQMAAGPVLAQLRAREHNIFSFQRNLKCTAEMELEVETGECGYVFDSEGNAARVAFVVLLRAERPNGMILIQVGKVQGGRIIPKLQMPATKARDGEDPAETAWRLLTQNLAEFGGARGLGRCTHDEEVRETPNYGMRTRFLRSVFHVPFDYGRTPRLVDYPSEDANSNLSAKKSVTSMTSQDGVRRKLAGLLPEQLYLVESGPARGTIYAWMSGEAHNLLSDKSNERLLHDWVAGVPMPAGLEFHAHERQLSSRMLG